MAMSDDGLPNPAHVFDGGRLDCGSGLILLIRQNMLQVPPGEVLEIRSQEPTVSGELPPWCRMVGHEYLSSHQVAPQNWRHFVRRNADEVTTDTESAATEITSAASSFPWSVRARLSGAHQSTLYARNHSWQLGTAFSFNKQDPLPTALEGFIGALLAEVNHLFGTFCDHAGIVIDELECHAHVTLVDPLAVFGSQPETSEQQSSEADEDQRTSVSDVDSRLETNTAGISQIKIVAYATSNAPADQLKQFWHQVQNRAPLLRTVIRSCPVEFRLVTM
jgi:TusA-related sulfurtransferase